MKRMRRKAKKSKTKRYTDLEKLPAFLNQFIVKQDYRLYTPIDHACWRYIMRVSADFFRDHAHPKYLRGVHETGIPVDRIPRIEEMDYALKRFGWRAVAISGFIPPGAFIEFESLGILPIACDMRTIEHIAYTPAPDIVHEAAGHAPLIVDADYGMFLKHYGETARKAIYSRQDIDVYEAIRSLSVIKEDPDSREGQIAAAERRLVDAEKAVTWISEATELARLFWWTTEYGLVGKKAPKIYGAGLLSSVGESYHCLRPEVPKVPLSVRCAEVGYDITRPQPQLFVVGSFKDLVKVVDQFAKTMAYKTGAKAGLDKAIVCETLTTVEFDSGVQISGRLVRYRGHSSIDYLHYEGPCQLSYGGKQLAGHGIDRHRMGFGTPVGNLKGSTKPVSKLRLQKNKRCRLEFASGVVVDGILLNSLMRKGRALVLTFKDCRVSLGDETLFDPAWGEFDLACGGQVVSVYGGAADREAYLEAAGERGQATPAMRTTLRPSNARLNELYLRIRQLRERMEEFSSKKDSYSEFLEQLTVLSAQVDQDFPDDWLSRLELLELSVRVRDDHSALNLRRGIENLARAGKVPPQLVERGLRLIDETSKTIRRAVKPASGRA